ncbi:hypothetical protein V2J09_018053 [Rumex salicifolius]
MVSKMENVTVKRLARLEALGDGQLSKDVPKKSNTSVPKKREYKNAKEVTKLDIEEDIDKQNEPVEDLDMDEDAQVEEEQFEGAQFEEVLV